MVEPGSTVTGAADDTGVTAAPATATTPVATKGWASYSNNKKLAIGAGAGAVVGLGIYIWHKRRANAQVGAANPAPSSASASGAGNTAPMYVLPSSNQDAVQGANDAALQTALGSIGTQLNSIGQDVNYPAPTVINATNLPAPEQAALNQLPPGLSPAQLLAAEQLIFAHFSNPADKGGSPAPTSVATSPAPITFPGGISPYPSWDPSGQLLRPALPVSGRLPFRTKL